MPSPLIPEIRYHDTRKAIDFLCDAFGFERHAVVENDGGQVEHAELTFGDGMLMLGAVRDNEYGRLVTTVSEVGKPTTGIYLVIDDVDGHCARARSAGAEILHGPQDPGYGGREYTCRDLEGNVWSFGSYDPWAPDKA